MAAALYGPAHPYGFTELGTEAVEQGDDARRHAGVLERRTSCRTTPRWSCRDRSRSAELRPLVEKAFGDWQKGTPAQPHARRRRRRPAARSCSSTSRARRRRSCASRPSACRARRPDYEALQVMNEALGGLFSSRINLNLREAARLHLRRELAVRVPPSRGAVPGRVRRPHRRDRAGGDGDLQGGPRACARRRSTADELALAKDSLVRSLPAQFETSWRVTEQHGEHLRLRSGPRLLHEAPGRLSAVTADQVKAAAEKYVVPEKMRRDCGRRPREDRRRAAEAESGAAEMRSPDGQIVPAVATR